MGNINSNTVNLPVTSLVTSDTLSGQLGKHLLGLTQVLDYC